MTMAEIIEVLRRNRLFRRLSNERLRMVALSAAEQRLAPGEMLFDRGEEGDAAYVVLNGAVLPRITVDGSAVTLARLGPGELFGEVAVLCDRPRTAAIVADGETLILRLDANVLGDLLAEFPELSLELIRSLAARLEHTSMELANARRAAAGA